MATWVNSHLQLTILQDISVLSWCFCHGDMSFWKKWTSRARTSFRRVLANSVSYGRGMLQWIENFERLMVAFSCDLRSFFRLFHDIRSTTKDIFCGSCRPSNTSNLMLPAEFYSLLVKIQKLLAFVSWTQPLCFVPEPRRSYVLTSNFTESWELIVNLRRLMYTKSCTRNSILENYSTQEQEKS
jgi:hypothetical protein